MFLLFLIISEFWYAYPDFQTPIIGILVSFYKYGTLSSTIPPDQSLPLNLLLVFIHG